MSASVLCKARFILSAMAVAAFSALLVVGCGKDDNPGGKSSGSSGGGLTLPNGYAWIIEGAVAGYESGYVFRSDNVLLAVVNAGGSWTMSVAGTWSTNGDTLNMTLSEAPMEYTYSVSGNTLTLSMGGAVVYTCTKKQIGIETDPDGPGGNPPVTNSNLVLGANEAWTAIEIDSGYTYAYGYIFRSNRDFVNIYKEGNVWYGEVIGTWSTGGNKLFVTISNGGGFCNDSFQDTATYVISNNTLTLTHSEGYTTTFTKTTGVNVIIESGPGNGGYITPPAAAVAPVAENVWTIGSFTSSDSNSVAWFAFNAVNGRTYYVLWDDRYSGPQTGTADIEIAVIYSDGTVIFEEDDWDSYDCTPSFTANKNGTVYIRVSPLSSGETGTFRVLWTTNPSGVNLGKSRANKKLPGLLSKKHFKIIRAKP